MTRQLLARYDSFDRAAFDDGAETRGQAGLSLLQLWSEEGGGAHWALFSVNDAGKARDWLDREAALGHGPAAHHMLRTA